VSEVEDGVSEVEDGVSEVEDGVSEMVTAAIHFRIEFNALTVRTRLDARPARRTRAEALPTSPSLRPAALSRMRTAHRATARRHCRATRPASESRHQIKVPQATPGNHHVYLSYPVLPDNRNFRHNRHNRHIRCKFTSLPGR
jgi:hypothetical protein